MVKMNQSTHGATKKQVNENVSLSKNQAHQKPQRKINSKIIIAYIPVLHEGYRQFLDRQKNIEELILIKTEFLNEMTHLKKDIRALAVEKIKLALESWSLTFKISIINQKRLKQIAKEKTPLLAPLDELNEFIVNKYLKNNPIKFDSVFLRWNKPNITHKHAPVPDFVLKPQNAIEKLMGKAYQEATKSADWWRQIGALLVKNNKVLLSAYNKHVPSEQQPYVDGDPRSSFFKGLNFELSTAMHAEANIISQAAKLGISTNDCDLYATTFACPACAKLIAYSGIRRFFYSEGYAVLDGERIMKSKDVEIIQIK